ncbi:hypothetical protein BCR33DRAFT_814620 [Rhizoclosmatium globosum]|uniref:Chitin-binding type-4 domain-containing protein n=1 Tax=Rhizoclosmatium globosum TaxID=329046 RepID=A0A1Y2D2S8_9FUNG|nr:hypothetical protein BCR33DRAFT_814620 [Rhizoclosmatium globosum]|eukprot:ORY52875.1 hypothetical protein BCR33DRAFT_814620 [Rhizoclosmatium globosum]
MIVPLAVLSVLASSASAHGIMAWPIMRTLDPKCGVVPENTSVQGSIAVKIPVIPAGATKYNAVIRWSYISNNGGQPANEAFGSCADVVVAANGKNDHNKYLLLAQGVDGDLPKDSPNYWDQSCNPAGSFQCGADTRFISQCVSLAASGGFGGGSSWYQYQCPKGTKCVTSGSNAVCK